MSTSHVEILRPLNRVNTWHHENPPKSTLTTPHLAIVSYRQGIKLTACTWVVVRSSEYRASSESAPWCSPRLLSAPHATKDCVPPLISTYDHRHLRTRDPVCSPIDKQVTARLVVGWVTTSESLVLYVFCFLISSNKIDASDLSVQ